MDIFRFLQTFRIFRYFFQICQNLLDVWNLFLIFSAKISCQDEKNQVLTTNIWLDHEWTDEMLTWDPAEFNNITKLRVRKHKGFTKGPKVNKNSPKKVLTTSQNCKTALISEFRILYLFTIMVHKCVL